MSVLLLFISFFFACAGTWIFFDGYFAATNQTEEFYAAVAGIAWALLPYLVAKTLSDMVAIRQRHLQLEQTSQFNYMMVEQIQMAEEAMRKEQAAAKAAAARAPISPAAAAAPVAAAPLAAATAPAVVPTYPPEPPAPPAEDDDHRVEESANYDE